MNKANFSTHTTRIVFSEFIKTQCGRSLKEKLSDFKVFILMLSLMILRVLDTYARLQLLGDL